MRSKFSKKLPMINTLRLKVLLLVCVVLSVSEMAMANYAQSQQLFLRRDYARAASGFFQTISYPRNNDEKLKAEFGLAESLARLGLLYSASKYYSIIVRRGPGPSNPFFRDSLDRIGTINQTVRLGRAHILQLFTKNVSASAVPPSARGFYFYYLGLDAFNKKEFRRADENFRKVPSNSSYHLGANFHLGIVSNLTGNSSRAVQMFESVVREAERSVDLESFKENATLNIARVHYERKDFRKAIAYYSMLPRDSDLYLDAIWESSWALFLMQNHNSTLGNIHTIHSPFFINRFYPESYILQALTFLRLCRLGEVRKSLLEFRSRYKDVFKDVQSMLSRFNSDPRGFFRLVYSYRTNSLNSFNDAFPILDRLSRTDDYKGAGDTIRFADREMNRLSDFEAIWRANGLSGDLKSFLESKKSFSQLEAGRALYDKAKASYSYLRDLSDQTTLIQAEMLEGKLDQLRKQINVNANNARSLNFVGGLEELNLAQSYEYWPFEGEYWEDELGFYVYNIGSKCTAK